MQCEGRWWPTEGVGEAVGEGEGDGDEPEPGEDEEGQLEGHEVAPVSRCNGATSTTPSHQTTPTVLSTTQEERLANELSLHAVNLQVGNDKMNRKWRVKRRRE